MKITFKDGSVAERVLSGEACQGYTALRIELTAEDLPTLNAWIKDGRCVPYIGQLASRLNRTVPEISDQSMYNINLRRIIHLIFGTIRDVLLEADDTDDLTQLHTVVDDYLDTISNRVEVVKASRAGDIDFTAVAHTVKGIVKDVKLIVQLETGHEVVSVHISKVASAPYVTRTRKSNNP